MKKPDLEVKSMNANVNYIGMVNLLRALRDASIISEAEVRKITARLRVATGADVIYTPQLLRQRVVVAARGVRVAGEHQRTSAERGGDSPWPIPQVLPAPAPVCDSSGARRPVGRLKKRVADTGSGFCAVREKDLVAM